MVLKAVCVYMWLFHVHIFRVVVADAADGQEAAPGTTSVS